MAFEEIRQRSDLLGTQVITRDTGKKLGVVSQLWVDIDQQEVVALSLRSKHTVWHSSAHAIKQHPADWGMSFWWITMM